MVAIGVADPPHSGVWHRQATAEAVGVAPDLEAIRRTFEIDALKSCGYLRD